MFRTNLYIHSFSVHFSSSASKLNLYLLSAKEYITVVKKTECEPKVSESRFNEINLQMISKNLYNQIFKNTIENHFLINDVSSVKNEFKKFGINTNSVSKVPDVAISIPTLEGKNIEDHFNIIANKQIKPYTRIIEKLLVNIPPMPQYFVLNEGWTRYSNSGYEIVDFPKEDGIILDVEVCVKNGSLPTIATAVSENAWYGWVSKDLVNEASQKFEKTLLTCNYLIPLESYKNDNGFSLNDFQQMPKIVVGHNISFDRARIKEQYWLNKTGTRFLDTMSIHTCISGINSFQRSLLKSKKLDAINTELHSISSLNNLADVYKLYCGMALDKKKRNLFLDKDIHEIKEQFNDAMLYCANDVIATYQILKKIFPLFLHRFPHPATLSGMLELGISYLPINYSWERFLEEAETTYEDLNLESKVCLSKQADYVCRLKKYHGYQKDLWMWNENWAVKYLKLNKGFDKIYFRKNLKHIKRHNQVHLRKKFNYLNKTKNFLPKIIPFMPGYPNWYRKLCNSKKLDSKLFLKAQNISTSMLITPKILNLQWKNFPLYYNKKNGWGFLIPCDSGVKKKKVSEVNNISNMGFSENIIHDCPVIRSTSNCINEHVAQIYFSNCYFQKLPHKNGIMYKVGNPLSKDFLNKFSENTLRGIDESASRILEISKVISYWKNNRDRIFSQLVVWFHNEPTKENFKYQKAAFNFGAIIPQVVVSGTLTRRAVEPTWMTASNVHCQRVGSELRAIITAPLNYNIVGADVDSQELWIASIIGDAFSKKFKIQGATPFSWMTLVGNKSEGTDMHSVTAKAVGISRDEAKIINYARIYGAGQNFAERLLKQFNPNMTHKEVIKKSKKMFSFTKGEKYYCLKSSFLKTGLIDKFYSKNEAIQISQYYHKTIKEIFEKSIWIGGSESSMFNSLEEIARLSEIKTPFLNSRLSRALEKEVGDNYLPTKINWVVQSSAVDFLHLILVCMKWLMKDRIRLCLSFHDEVRYLVPSSYKYNAALALHVTNLLVRSFFVSRLNMKDLPMSVAFFTSVEVDLVLRKDASNDCQTLSNPHGLQDGYKIKLGETLSVEKAIEKSKGCVGLHSSNSMKIN